MREEEERARGAEGRAEEKIQRGRKRKNTRKAWEEENGGVEAGGEAGGTKKI